MRSRFTLAFVPVLAVLALALVPAGSGAAPAAKTTKVKCTAKGLKNQFPKLSPKGYDFGFASCGSPLGKGVTVVYYNQTISSTLSATGKTVAWLNDGTITATYKASGPISSGSITVSGTAKVTGGTGKFKGAKGTGKISCTTSDLGQTLDCTENLTFSKL